MEFNWTVSLLLGSYQNSLYHRFLLFYLIILGHMCLVRRKFNAVKTIFNVSNFYASELFVLFIACITNNENELDHFTMCDWYQNVKKDNRRLELNSTFANY